ncbi:hypothetical protein BOTBODRAFT_130176 [Botryobasidium botryosum FD-172 SS1]|uniref:HORMA domain-containing protein n=1 Tax=Botryobasidium botryosum (strain FD-172 SS1) TaxID=930990 RepID=A0A067MKU8_BOTB1|nr:hypothetical protein BOTBODRAFT_130176 [Botryobasidium botryosum FD-172 SS1]
MPPASKQSQRGNITLKGSTALVTEFFKFAVNSILYHRGIYPADDFHMVKKYGQVVLVTQDLGLEKYIDNILQQVHEWLMSGTIKQLVLAVIAKETRITLERWVFDIHLQEPPTTSDGKPAPPKPESEIQSEIRAVIKQIVASNTFLPTLNEPTVFNILAFTENADIPTEKWVDTDAHAIEPSKAQQVKLRSFDTQLHKIEAMVAYRYDA